MNGKGSLGNEIQRKTAEIEDWPNWAKPYDRQPPTSGDRGSARPRSQQSRDSGRPSNDQPG